MKKYNNIFLIAVFILSMIFSGCSKEDKEDIKQEIPEIIPALQLGAETIAIKIGSENKYSLDIKQGGGEYSVFSLNEEIAIAELTGDKIYIEGVANGTTSVVVSDKNGFYRKLPVKVYTTDILVLKDYDLELVTLLGQSGLVTTNVVLGNGGYQVTPDNPKVKAFVTEDGIITIIGTSQKDTFTATVTVTDASGLSASITLTVESTTNPFSAEKLKEIMSDDRLVYAFDDMVFYQANYTYYNTIDNGQQLYGWNLFNFFYFKLWYTGDKTVGKKQDGKFSFSFSGTIFTNEPVNVEIIKNDGVNLWGIFFFGEDEAIHYGYFCDKI